MKKKLILGAAWTASVAGAFVAGVYLTRQCIFDAINEVRNRRCRYAGKETEARR